MSSPVCLVRIREKFAGSGAPIPSRGRDRRASPVSVNGSCVVSELAIRPGAIVRATEKRLSISDGTGTTCRALHEGAEGTKYARAVALSLSRGRGTESLAHITAERAEVCLVAAASGGAR